MTKELRKRSPALGREIIRKVLDSNNGNVSLTAKILNISRNTVRRARDGDLEDKSRRPKTSPKKISAEIEEIIIKYAKITGFRYRRLSKYIRDKLNIHIS
ncbi:MAG: IS481 family transposase, partial [Proteobacteria bacterium]|nr:IS481 family transposase [Pseudomonadota bacterium]